MSKESISQDHMERTKRMHAEALLYVRPMFLQTTIVTGAEHPGSIGESIVQTLETAQQDVLAPSMEDMDVRNPSDIQNYLSIRDIDNLVCCHGITKMAWFEEMEVEDITDVIDTNLTGSALVAREFVHQTLRFPWRKRIVFIGSMAYNHVLNASAAYCASKAGLAMLTRCLAWELAPKGYDVICLHPSNTEGTPMSEETISNIMAYRHISREEAEDYWAAVLPRGRWLQPYDIARWVRNFLEDESGYLSGANVELGGGTR